MGVYALSLYAPSAAISSPSKGFFSGLRLSKSGTGPRTFLMQLTFKASGEKMSSALCKSLKSRYKGDMSELSNKIVSGCGSGGGGKGTTFQFSCNKDDISVSINGKDMGKVHGPGIGAGFCDI